MTVLETALVSVLAKGRESVLAKGQVSVLAKGEVDADKVGLVGHSWGAYQTAFIVTRSNLCAAGVAGAPLTNMMSMSMSIYWNSGQTDAVQVDEEIQRQLKSLGYLN